MPIKKSAKKHMKVSAKKSALNKKRKLAFRAAIKKLSALVKDNKKKDAKETFIEAQKTLDKAAKAGTIKKETAARKKSRLSKMIKSIS